MHSPKSQKTCRTVALHVCHCILQHRGGVKGAAPKVARVELRVFATNEIKMPAVSSMSTGTRRSQSEEDKDMERAQGQQKGVKAMRTLAQDSFQKFANGFKRNEAGNQ